MKNLSGGVLRKNIWSIYDETNAQTGIFQTSENTEGNIIKTIDSMRVVGFRYSDYSYQDSDGGTCGWITSRPLNEGECRMWGNPIAEMMYEALRYFAGKGSPTESFKYDGNQDAGLDLSKPDWGIKKGNTTYQPPDLFPYCAKPFMLVFSDVNNSYDSDKIPGSSFASFTGDLTGLDASSLANTISEKENISGNWFIGQVESSTDFLCTPKNFSNLSSVRGLCPEEPTKQGSYYPASVAYYGNTKFKQNNANVKTNVTTYAVALSSPVPDISIKIGNNTVRIVPTGKSVSGCLGVFDNCASKCTLTSDSGGLKITNCQSSAFCPTNQIVDFYVENVNYDASGNLTSATFRINFEDVEQGADHDMDAIVRYEITPVGSNGLKVKLTSEYAAGCIDQAMGFTITGTTEDGTYLVVRDNDSGNADDDTPSTVANMPITWEKTFTVSTSSAAGQLKEPLWYAAKWGGFRDINGNGIPDLPQEWDENGDGIPDTYFKVNNPLRLEAQLEAAFSDILRRASSGANVATLSSRTGISSIMLQPYYYPEYQTETGETLGWLGFLRSLWIDYDNNLREDTVMQYVLNTSQDQWDKILYFVNSSEGTKLALLKGGTNNDITIGNQNVPACTLDAVKDLKDMKAIFDVGCLLANQDVTSRTIKFNNNGALTDFTTNNASILKNIWKTIDSTIDDTKARCIIRYLRGENLASDTTCSGLDYVKRTRELNIQSLCGTLGSSNIKTWKLGAIVHSTPSIVSNQPANAYHLKYGDTTYRDFIMSNTYTSRPSIAFFGANDGMLHAVRIGTVVAQKTPGQIAKLKNSPTDSGTDKIGKEEWAFIPKNAIPYLLWYGYKGACSGQGYIPTVDYRTMVWDAKINNSWKTLLIGTMGFGGKQLGSYSSSIFVLDITDPLSPSLLWERTLDEGVLTLSFPVVIRNPDGWFLVVGGGPKDYEGANFGTAKLYFLSLDSGQTVKTLTVTGTAAIGDLNALDFDSDYYDDAIYFGTYSSGFSSGDLYRIALRSNSGITRISDLANGDVRKVVSVGKPIFAAPVFSKDEDGNLWVFFGTGRFLAPSDRTISGITNYLIGFIDPWGKDYSTSTTYSISNFTNTTNTVVTSEVKTTKKQCVCGSSSCSLVNVVTDVSDSTPRGRCKNDETKSCLNNADCGNGNNAVCLYPGKSYCSNDSTRSCNQNSDCGQSAVCENRGWYYALNGESIFSKPLVYGGIVEAVSFKPVDDPCAGGGLSNLIALYYKTGTAPPRPSILDPSATTPGSGSQVTVNPKILLGYGAPPIGEAFVVVPNPFEEGEFRVFTNIIGGGGSDPNNPLPSGYEQGQNPSEGIILWIEK
ncbi:MAG: PilC/PilY family type IV pilus protein [Nitrososphaerota archaeon]